MRSSINTRGKLSPQASQTGTRNGHKAAYAHVRQKCNRREPSDGLLVEHMEIPGDVCLLRRYEAQCLSKSSIKLPRTF